MFSLRVRSCLSLMVFVGMLGLLSVLPDRQAWAESPYPREQVEEHLRTMFPNPHMDNVAKQFRPHVGFFTQKKNVRVGFMGLHKNEGEPTKIILIKLFNDILEIQGRLVNASKEEFHLLVMVSDDLSIDGLHSTYRQVFKVSKSEEEYLKTIHKESPEDHKSLFQTYIRNPSKIYVIYATERDYPKKEPRRTFEELMRYALIRALTMAMNSNVIQPSAVNDEYATQKSNSFAPIDRAVLRAIFAYDDWADLKYETQMQRLTDRVMQQLKNTT